MDFHFPQKIRLGQGVSQHVGLAAKEGGSRTLLLTESSFDSSKELTILTQSLERAGVAFIVLSKGTEQSSSSFLSEAATLGRASRAESIMVLGGNTLLSWGRALAIEISKGQKDSNGKKSTAGLPYIEVPTSTCFPLLLREEAFLDSMHPSELRFINTPLFHKHRIFLDPHMVTGITAVTSVTGLLETLFFAVEAYYSELSGLTEQSLLLGAIGAIWSNLEKIYKNPAAIEHRWITFQAGWNVALALALIPRNVGLTLTLVLGGLIGLPATALGSLFLAPFLEVYGPKSVERTQRLAQVMGAGGWDGAVESLGPKLAQDVRKFLNVYQLPLRLTDYQAVEAQTVLAADVVQGLNVGNGGLLPAKDLPEFLQFVT